MDVNEHERLPQDFYNRPKLKVKERKNMDVNEHERLTFSSISFLTTSCFSSLICVYCNTGIVSHVHLHPYPFLPFL
jgi:hypothetical protein